VFTKQKFTSAALNADKQNIIIYTQSSSVSGNQVHLPPGTRFTLSSFTEALANIVSLSALQITHNLSTD